MARRRSRRTGGRKSYARRRSSGYGRPARRVRNRRSAGSRRASTQRVVVEIRNAPSYASPLAGQPGVGIDGFMTKPVTNKRRPEL